MVAELSNSGSGPKTCAFKTGTLCPLRWKATKTPPNLLFGPLSQRRACDILQVDRSTVRYLSRRGDDTELRDAIKRISRERRRFGCRRIHVMIARDARNTLDERQKDYS